MNYLVYILAYPFLWLFSRIPFALFYIFSDFMYYLLYYVVGYRKRTVRKNLELAFPNLNKEERLEIEKKSFRHLCDTFLEMAKTISLPEKEMRKRFQFTNLDYLLELEKENKSIMLFCAHYANWEWTIVLGNQINFQGFAVYKKINNPYFDAFIKRTRSRFNTILIEIKETIRVVRKNEIDKKHGVYAFISDQSPMVSQTNYWHEFMGIEVPVYTGGEALVKKYDITPLYLKVEYVSRGHYKATFVPLLNEDEVLKEIPNYEITNRFLKEVEKQLIEAPEYYFWTHKRWKHRGKKPKNL
ncbi:lysophospholipid acyltransferase family protein [Myroides guanonis]|uniref:KDO2-lipid IV(A) lauroyltransferase n=1 Tax=Myroides guanonis TaxID=1150112 RepID=A0A1I3TDB9_9FLAO|nr:lipid A biosynthesis acyltransferase [Myroides guanonis]SFJ69178.1 KDO2-lipid IV(A) lauroyltransferase [Myroides guanonis]